MRAREATWADLWEEARHADILAVAERLNAKLKHTGADWIGACPNGCAKTDGFIVTPGKGIFLCRPSKATGDVIKMVAHVKGYSAIEAAEWITGQARPDRSQDESPQERDARQAIATQRAAEREKRETEKLAAEEEKARRTRRLIKAYIRELVPIRGSPGEQYLAEERKIATDAIADVLERTDAIGWHSAVHFYEPGHPLNGQKLNCIVGIMSNPMTAEPTGAISRTYLGPDGKKITKAKTFGSPIGIIRLSEDADVLHGLHIAEGLETALAMMAQDFRPMWSTGSTALMATFPVLPAIEELMIFADHDENRAGEEAARACERRWRGTGREVRLWRPNQLGDFNDVLRREPAK